MKLVELVSADFNQFGSNFWIILVLFHHLMLVNISQE